MDKGDRNNRSFRFVLLCLFLVIAETTVSQVVTTTNGQPVAPILEVDAADAANRVLTMIDQGQVEEARTLLNRALVRPYQAESVPLLHALAALHARRSQFVDEAATYDDILQLVPKDHAALRGLVFAVLRMGAPQLAAHYATLDAGIFTAAEIGDLQQAAAGRSIKWGELEARAGVGPQRFQATDRALAKSAEVHALHRGADAINSPSGQRTEFDRIIALRDRGRMDEVIELYGDLTRRKVEVPAYALAAVADAYLDRRKPERARDLYLQALTLSKNDREYPNREWQLQLFDAYMDANQFHAARQLIDQLEREIPPILNRGLPGLELDNEFYAQTRVNAARLRLYSDELARSESMLDKLLESAPFNLDARLTYGDLMQARDRPRAARRHFRSVLVDDPANVDAAVGIAETALALHDPGTAKTYASVLTENYPESRVVQRVQRELTAYRRPVLTLTSETGRSPTGSRIKGDSDWLVNATLFLAPFRDHWRLFAHSFNAAANFKSETATRKRIGLGVEYRAPAWEASAELNQKQFALDELGVSLQSAWMPDDQWRISLEFDSQSNDLPLQASAAGVNAKALGLGVTYLKNESSKLNANLAQLRFSDRNRRTQGGADWTQRWVSGPAYKLDTRLGVFASDNTLRDAPYFNPRRDLSLDLNVINEWPLWRRYERSLKHRVELGIGGYAQQGFAAKLSSALRYEHEWNLNSFRTLSYGVAFNRQAFDGVLDNRASLFLNLNWHF